MDDKTYYRMKVQEVLDDLHTTANGLETDEAARRIDQYGKNELTAKIEVPRWMLFVSQFKDLLVIILMVAAAISLIIGSLRDAVVMIIIVLVNASIGFLQEYKVSKILESLKTLIQSPARALRGGELTEVPQDQLVPGDIIRLEAGDKIPADIRVIESFDLRTEDFALTGESMPQGKNSTVITEDCVIGDQDNMVFMGTTVTSGSATGVVVRTGMQAEMGRIAGMTQTTEKVTSPLERELGALARWLTVTVVIISAFLFAVSLWQGFSLFISMVFALGIAVALVPQALPAQVTVALSTTSKRLAEHNAVVRSLPSVETLGSTSVISTDKTGTLTKNEMTVTAIWFNGARYSMTGVGYEPQGKILGEGGDPLDQKGIDEIEIMMDAATMASNAEIHAPDEEHDTWYPIGDPTEAALVTMSTKIGTRSPAEDKENPELKEFPFDSERKLMSSVRQFADGHQLAMKGAIGSVLSISKHIYRDGRAEPITEKDKEAIIAVNEEFSKKALRVLAIAYRPLELEEAEKDVTFLGLVGMTDPPREGVEEAIAVCHGAGIRTFIMTGDHQITAQAVGMEIGLSGSDHPSPVITGKELKAMDDAELTAVMAKEESLIFSRVDPEDKLRIVELLEKNGEVVAVTGDGVNDAPALRRADIGVAMGKIGTDVAKEASDLVLLDDSFPTLVEAIREGRTIYSNLRKTVLASMTTNGAELVVVLLGLAAVTLKGWAIPIFAIQILAIDLLAEIMPLTCLTFDPGFEGIMKRPPRDLGEHILNRITSLEVMFLGLIMGTLAFVNYALFMSRQGTVFTMDSLDPLLYARATTITYLTIAFCQFVNILSHRFERTSIFNSNFFSNRILIGSIGGSILLVLLVVHTPGVRDFLRFAPPSPIDWLYVLGSAALYLFAFEALKMFKRTGVADNRGAEGNKAQGRRKAEKLKANKQPERSEP
ncbi:MAG: cation-transporting P-type ATPase [Deltaproteobacteria bacterium]|nr:cation-transporting P-type ATPase [Deltaproteobacteria bacterium]